MWGAIVLDAHPPVVVDEAARLADLYQLDVLDTSAEERFDRITRTTARLFDVPVAAIVLVDAGRHWVKSALGMAAGEPEQPIAPCTLTVLHDGPTIIPDLGKEPQFASSPPVCSDPLLRLYAGQPLKSRAGRNIGAL